MDLFWSIWRLASGQDWAGCAGRAHGQSLQLLYSLGAKCLKRLGHGFFLNCQEYWRNNGLQSLWGVFNPHPPDWANPETFPTFIPQNQNNLCHGLQSMATLSAWDGYWHSKPSLHCTGQLLSKFNEKYYRAPSIIKAHVLVHLLAQCHAKRPAGYQKGLESMQSSSLLLALTTKPYVSNVCTY